MFPPYSITVKLAYLFALGSVPFSSPAAMKRAVPQCKLGGFELVEENGLTTVLDF